ncbi:MAG: hypothetical protein KME55_02655 [Nostoc indistinguendum CM1-VF10]|nr:hypothetical protein [Nostoc indistinguendum CM1-VF10]
MDQLFVICFIFQQNGVQKIQFTGCRKVAIASIIRKLIVNRTCETFHHQGNPAR